MNPSTTSKKKLDKFAVGTHDVFTTNELRFLHARGLITKNRDGVASIDTAAVEAAFVEQIHSRALVTTTDELTLKGITVARLAEDIFETTNPVYNVPNRTAPDGTPLDALASLDILIDEVKKASRKTHPTSSVQKRLTSLDPTALLIAATVKRKADDQGADVIAPVAVLACTHSSALLQAYDLEPRTTRTRNTITAKAKRDRLLVEQMPEMAIPVAIAARKAVAFAASELSDTVLSLTSGMTDEEKATWETQYEEAWRPIAAQIEAEAVARHQRQIESAQPASGTAA